MSEPTEPSELTEGLDNLRRVLQGLAVKALGPAAAPSRPVDEADRPAVSPDFDAAVERVSATLGQWLKVAGEELQRQAGHGEQGEEAPADGWSPLVHGARSLGRGLSEVARELIAGGFGREGSPASPEVPADPAGEPASPAEPEPGPEADSGGVERRL